MRLLRRLMRGGLRRARRAVWRWVPDRIVYARTFKQCFGRRLDLRRPRTFNEKLYWLMLNYRRPILHRLADKYEVREYVAERIGARYLNELHGVWDDPRSIDFEGLPRTFVLKISGGWNMNIFCRDRARFDATRARRQLAAWLRQPHYLARREWAYKGIRSKVMAERLLVDAGGAVPPDFKFFCFDGEPRFIQVDTDRFTDHRRDCFDPGWQLTPFTYQADRYPRPERPMPRPPDLDEMLECARRLAAGFPFVRVDCLVVGRRLVFGELTFYPAAGHGRFAPDSFDRYWGDAIPLRRS